PVSLTRTSSFPLAGWSLSVCAVAGNATRRIAAQEKAPRRKVSTRARGPVIAPRPYPDPRRRSATSSQSARTRGPKRRGDDRAVLVAACASGVDDAVDGIAAVVLRDGVHVP